MEFRVSKIDKSEDEYESFLLHKEYYAEKVKPLKTSSRRRLEVLAVRTLLKEMTGEEQEVIYDKYGAPSFKTLSKDRNFLSISHTDGFVAVILGEKPVGIDVEKRGRRVEQVKSKFLQDAEMSLVETISLSAENFQSSQSELYLLCLHLIWSAKEAAFKVLGQEYFDLQNLTCVTEIDFLNKQIKMNVEGKTPFTIHFDFTEEYVLCYLISD